MRRSLSILILLALIIGLVISSGCIAIPAGLQGVNTNDSSIPQDIRGPGDITQGNQSFSPEYTQSITKAGTDIQGNGIQAGLGEGTVRTTPIENSKNRQQDRVKDTGSSSGADTVSTSPTGISPPVTMELTPTTWDQPGQLVPVTPYPIETHPTDPPMIDPDESPPETTYRVIFDQTLAFNYNATAFSYYLAEPPLIIEYTVEPKMFTDLKAYTSRFGKKEDEVVTTQYPSPDAWFELVVRDKITGNIVLKDGYGEGYTEDTDQKVKVLEDGDYQIDFHGNDVTVHIRMQARE